jgi:hypothetical protein
MAEIVNVSTIERHLFGPDAIPWQHLKLPSNLQKLQDRYKFPEIRQGVDGQENVIQLKAAGGEFLIEEVPRAVEHLLLEPNAVEFQLSVGSDKSGLFFEDLVRLLVEMDPNRAFSNQREYVRTYQTIVTARLSIPFEALLSEPLRRFLRESVPQRVSLPDSVADIRLERLGWKISYKTQSTEFLYRPKHLTIEPRAGSDPEEQLYYTQSPTEFKTHIEMLEEFEKSFVG